MRRLAPLTSAPEELLIKCLACHPRLLGPLLVFAALGWSRSASAQAAGAHLGINLDHGNVHLGVDVHLPLAQLGSRVRWGLWPSYAHVFIEEGHDVELLGLDVPFEFLLDQSRVTPFVAPGLGLAFYGDTTLKLNAIGGAFFDVGHHVRPFTALAIRFIRGTFVDLLAGVLIEF